MGVAEIAACSAFLGLALAAKHSAPVILLAITLIGAALALGPSSVWPQESRGLKLAKVGALVAGAMLILWATYLFRYSESSSAAASFNRPVAEKLSDVSSGRYRAVLEVMAATHVVPRAYLWGFADTIRAGLEGRESPKLFFGKLYHFKGPRYFFPGTMLVKIPIGLLALIALGLFLFFARRIPADWLMPSGIVFGVALFFLAVLSTGATYAGVRHALPVVLLLAIFGGVAVAQAFSSKKWALAVFATVSLTAAAVSAVPQMRPWEYFNEFVGGSANAYKYFSDEGVDLGQRSKEMTEYYKREPQPNGVRPVCLYWVWDEERPHEVSTASAATKSATPR